MNALDILKERGFLQQCSDEAGLKKLFSSSKVVYYIGFDPTAESLHIGSLLPIMAMASLQRAGHIPITLVGGGTALIGDPSWKAKERPLADKKEIEKNSKEILAQLKQHLSFGKGIFLNNAGWLLNLNYIEFLRDIGKYFRVNEMIKREGYRIRLERKEGLSFIEFNYQLLQAYDFLKLFEKYNCRLQMGGDDQWGNILAGVDLIRRVKGKQAFALTFPLIETAQGQKMGKTEKGTIWLSSKRTPVYYFYQYWINTDDRDVVRFLKLFTFLPMPKIKELANLQGADIREAKEILAFEATKITHGEKEARAAQMAAKAAFVRKGGDLTSLPTTVIKKTRISAGIRIVDLLYEAGLVPSKSEASRLIRQGGIYINDKKVSSGDMIIKENLFKDGSLLLRKGKKQYRRVIIE